MKKYILENLSCGHCAGVIEAELKKQDFIRAVSIDFSTTSMLIDTDEIERVASIISSIEHDITIKEFVRVSSEQEAIKTDFQPKREFYFTLGCVVLFSFAMIYHYFMGPGSDICAPEDSFFIINKTNFVCLSIFILTYIVSGYKVVYKAFLNIKRGGFFDENSLMTIATLGAFAINAFPEAAGVMIFFRVGEYLQELSIHRSRKSIKALLEIRPDYANIVIGEETTRVSPDLVEIGNEILVKPGEKVPLDGEIISGQSQIDTSALTGESVPRLYREKDIILAGMINNTGLLRIRVTKLFSESSITKILDLVENATHKKAKTEMFFTTFAKYYTPAIVLLALLTAFVMPFISTKIVLTEWIHRSLVMLMISCPCALVVSIPLTYFGGIGGASKKGILIKGSSFLDSVIKVKNIVFDKTGTLTKGVFNLQKIEPFNAFTEDELLETAAFVESQSNHPIAVSILKAYFDIHPPTPPSTSPKLMGGVCSDHTHPHDHDHDHTHTHDHSHTHDHDGVSSCSCSDADVCSVSSTSSSIFGGEAVSDYQEIAGQGISAIVRGKQVLAGNARMMKENRIEYTEYLEAGTIVYIAIGGIFAGYLVISDELKEDSSAAMKKLQRRGIKSLMVLSGDNQRIVEDVAKKLSIKKFYADLLPENKVNILQAIIENTPQNEKTIFVGDGINDAPVLALADIGISMGNMGSDAAIETADIVIMNDSLLKIPELFKIAHKTRSIVIQNIIIALGVKSLFLILGFFGVATMWEAVFADVGVTLIAVFNAGRILKM